MDYDEKVEFLKSYQYHEDRINTLEVKKERYESMRDRVGGSIARTPDNLNGKGSFPTAIAEIERVLNNLTSEIKRAEKAKNRVIRAIDTAPNADYRRVLWHRYVGGLTLEQIARTMPYNSRHHVSVVHKKAVGSIRVVTNRNK